MGATGILFERFEKWTKICVILKNEQKMGVNGNYFWTILKVNRKGREQNLFFNDFKVDKFWI